MQPVRRPEPVRSYLTLSNAPPLRNPYAESSSSPRPGPSRITPTPGGSSTRNTEADLGFKTTPGAKLQYHVQHGLFKWTIENFSGFPQVSDKYCLSPTFVLKEIWWLLTLHPKVNLFGTDRISLNIIRHRSDLGPKSVRASYRLGLKSGGNNLWLIVEENITFGKGDSYGFQTSTLGHLEDFLENDTLTIMCEIYIWYSLGVNSTPSSPGNIIDIDKDLPSNLVSIYRTGELHDVIIEIPKKRVQAHRSVLCARSRTFARRLEDGKTVTELTCTQSCLDCVLLYMYSSNFDYLVKNAIFGIGLYELACELALDRLIALLKPHEVRKRSKIVVDTFSAECVFYDFDVSDILRDSKETGVYFDRTTGIGVDISLQKLDSYETVDVLVKVSGTIAALDFSFELYLLDMDNEPINMIPATFSSDSEFSYENLISTYSVRFSVIDMIRCYLYDGHLRMVFVCQKHSLIHLPEDNAVSPVTRLDPCVDPDVWLEDLSEDLRRLFVSSNVSDLTVVTGSDQSFFVHRSILTARSPHFHKLFFYDQLKNQVLYLDKSEILPRAYELMFTYMYTGTLRDFHNITRDDILDLYEACEEFTVSSLKRYCEKELLRSLDPFFVQDVFSVAEYYDNTQLADACEEYIRNNCDIDEVTSSESDSEETDSD